MMKNIVIIADIVGSKKITDRNRVQTQLKQELKEINATASHLLSPYTITLGDEFQAVYSNPQSILQDLLHITVRLFPIRIRFSIGIGAISTDINPNEALGMDGPAFYLARDGINCLKKVNHSVIQIYGSNTPCCALINTSLQLVMSLMDEWKQNTLLILHSHLRGIPVKEIASDLHISERGVYKAIVLHKVRYFTDFFLALEDRFRTLELS